MNFFSFIKYKKIVRPNHYKTSFCLQKVLTKKIIQTYENQYFNSKFCRKTIKLSFYLLIIVDAFLSQEKKTISVS